MVRANDLDRQPSRIVYRNRVVWWSSVLGGGGFFALGLATAASFASHPGGSPWWLDGLMFVTYLFVVPWFLLGIRVRFEVVDGVIHIVNKIHRYDIPLDDVASFDVGPFIWCSFKNHYLGTIRVHRRDGTVVSSGSGCRDPRIVRQFDEMRRGVWPYEKHCDQAASSQQR